MHIFALFAIIRDSPLPPGGWPPQTTYPVDLPSRRRHSGILRPPPIALCLVRDKTT